MLIITDAFQLWQVILGFNWLWCNKPLFPSKFQNVLVSFICQLDWITGRPDIWLNNISECVCEYVLDEISISVGRLSEVDGLPWCGSWAVWLSVNQLRAWLLHQGGDRENLASLRLPAWVEPSVFSCPWTVMYSRGSPCSQDYATGFPGATPYRWCRGLLVPCNSVTNSL